MEMVGRYNDEGGVEFDIELSDGLNVPFILLYNILVSERRFDMIGNYREDITLTDSSFGTEIGGITTELKPYIEYLETLGSISDRMYGSYRITDPGLFKFNIRNDLNELREIYENLDYYNREFILENLP